MKERKHAIDAFRLLAAFALMTLHTTYGSLDEEIVNNFRLLARWGSPYFFMITGYFLARKIKNGVIGFDSIKKNIIALINILMVASLVYIPINTFIKGRFNYITSNALTGTYIHLWFIGATLYGYISFWYLHQVQKQSVLPYLSIGALLLAVFSACYDHIFGVDVQYELYHFLLCIPFIYIGSKLANIDTSKFNPYLLCLVILFGAVLSLFEAEFIVSNYGADKREILFMFGSILMTVPTFILATKIKMKENYFVIWGRKHSLFIYLYHNVFYIGISYITAALPAVLEDYASIFSPFITFIIVLFAAIYLDKYANSVYRVLGGNFWMNQTKQIALAQIRNRPVKNVL